MSPSQLLLHPLIKAPVRGRRGGKRTRRSVKRDKEEEEEEQRRGKRVEEEEEQRREKRVHGSRNKIDQKDHEVELKGKKQICGSKLPYL